jgi:hypothetical protein
MIRFMKVLTVVSLLVSISLLFSQTSLGQGVVTQGGSDTLASTTATRHWINDQIFTGASKNYPAFVTVTNEASGTKIVYVAEENDTSAANVFHISVGQGSFTWLTKARWVRRLPSDTTGIPSQVIVTPTR